MQSKMSETEDLPSHSYDSEVNDLFIYFLSVDVTGGIFNKMM